MYTKEQIVEEIRRIAAIKGTDFLRQKDFELNSTIPMSTVSFYMGSWQRALKEAKLGEAKDHNARNFKEEPKNNDDLLKDLMRLYEESGAVPTLALIQEKGKYADYHYQERWKSISDAFWVARNKFGRKKQEEKPEKDANEEIDFDSLIEAGLGPHDETISTPIKVKPRPEPKPEPKPSPEPTPPIPPKPKPAPTPEPPPAPTPSRREETGPDLLVSRVPEGSLKIKFIPETIKPKKSRKGTRHEPESLDFRGLRFAPVNKKGVIYLFGMVAHELGFSIEAFAKNFPDAEGKRCQDKQDPIDLWEPVSLCFEYKSSDFESRGYDLDENPCDVLVCWLHDWDPCPLEVLELRSIIDDLKGN